MVPGWWLPDGELQWAHMNGRRGVKLVRLSLAVGLEEVWVQFPAQFK
jgi:hypothetical protein